MKRFFAFVLCVCMLAAFAACDTAEPTTTAKEETKVEQTTLTSEDLCGTWGYTMSAEEAFDYMGVSLDETLAEYGVSEEYIANMSFESTFDLNYTVTETTVTTTTYEEDVASYAEAIYNEIMAMLENFDEWSTIFGANIEMYFMQLGFDVEVYAAQFGMTTEALIIDILTDIDSYAQYLDMTADEAIEAIKTVVLEQLAGLEEKINTLFAPTVEEDVLEEVPYTIEDNSVTFNGNTFNYNEENNQLIGEMNGINIVLVQQ